MTPLPYAFVTKLRAFAAHDSDPDAARELVAVAHQTRDLLPLTADTRGALGEITLRPGAPSMLPLARTLRRIFGPRIGLGEGRLA